MSDCLLGISLIGDKGACKFIGRMESIYAVSRIPLARVNSISSASLPALLQGDRRFYRGLSIRFKYAYPIWGKKECRGKVQLRNCEIEVKMSKGAFIQ
jgi:hypothetical protein